MKLRKVENTPWWAVERPNAKVVEYLRRGIPALYRYFDSTDMRWLVHDKVVDDVRQLMSTTQDVLDDDPYAALHLRPTAPRAIIKAAWRELCKTAHPDKGGDPEEFKRITAAYNKLMDKG